MFSDHNGIKLEINLRKKISLHLYISRVFLSQIIWIRSSQTLIRYLWKSDILSCVRVSRERKPVGCVYIHIYRQREISFLIGTCDCTGITNFKSAGQASKLKTRGRAVIQLQTQSAGRISSSSKEVSLCSSKASRNG